MYSSSNDRILYHEVCRNPTKGVAKEKIRAASQNATRYALLFDQGSHSPVYPALRFRRLVREQG